MLLFNGILKGFKDRKIDFNTSNVTIQLVLSFMCNLFLFHFNTSNVTIQPDTAADEQRLEEYFNTSNVTIQHILTPLSDIPFYISIHLMLLFNPTILSHLFYSQFRYIHYISIFS